MIFSSFEFIGFFVVVVALLAFIKANPIKKGILILASYYFYSYWDHRFAFLIFAMTYVNYLAGNKISASQDESARKKWLIASVVVNLVILGFFKYFNFFIDSFNVLLSGINIQLSTIKIFLPLGISFITFQVMSYVIDIYRGVNQPAKTFWDFALFVAFFPHVIAGPIFKPKQFLPQIENQDISIKWENVSYGCQLFLLGLVRKVLIADRLGMFVDPVFKSPQEYSSATLWLAVLAYAIQIYCDFAGYSDMAIGTARCLGFEIPKNFDLPYISQNITEFWRRWHISLSMWLRDYLYITLGGNRKGKVRQYVNLLTTMLLGGLWHGSSWNFVVWGGLHGTALAVHKVYMEYIEKKYRINSYLASFLGWLTTLAFVCLSWIFFRATDFTIALTFLGKMFAITNTEGINWYASSLNIALPGLIICDYLQTQLYQGYKFKLTSFRELFILFFALFGLVFLAPNSPSPFIYLQF